MYICDSRSINKLITKILIIYILIIYIICKLDDSAQVYF